MRLRVLLLCAFAPAFIACVADEPSVAAVDAGEDSQAPTDSQAPMEAAAMDTGTPVDGGGVTCNPTAPGLFGPKADAGPFCQGAAAGNHCNLGDHCCFNTTSNVRSCAATCAAGVVDIACFSAAECAPGTACCGNGTVQTSTCAYPVVSGFTSSVCAATCAGNEFVACSSNPECGGKLCTPAYVLNATGTATSTLALDECQ